MIRCELCGDVPEQGHERMHAYELKRRADQAAYRAALPHDRDGVLAALRELTGDDQEADHGTADELLLALINDPEITAVYAALPKWYA